MELSVYVDGKFYPQSEAKVSVFDHGLLYGDGVFEGIRAYNGRIFKLERHLERLFHSAKAIDLKIPHTKEEMANLILETCRRNEIREGYIRPVITRGKGDLGLDPRKCKSGPSVVIIAQPQISLYGKVYDRGMKVVTSSYRRVPPQSLSPSIKSLNYLNNIMARVVANQYGAGGGDRPRRRARWPGNRRWEAGSDDEANHEGVPGSRDDDRDADPGLGRIGAISHGQT